MADAKTYPEVLSLDSGVGDPVNIRLSGYARHALGMGGGVMDSVYDTITGRGPEELDLSALRDTMVGNWFSSDESRLSSRSYARLYRSWEDMSPGDQQQYLADNPDFAESCVEIAKIDTLMEDIRTGLEDGSGQVKARAVNGEVPWPDLMSLEEAVEDISDARSDAGEDLEDTLRSGSYEGKSFRELQADMESRENVPESLLLEVQSAGGAGVPSRKIAVPGDMTREDIQTVEDLMVQNYFENARLADPDFPDMDGYMRERDSWLKLDTDGERAAYLLDHPQFMEICTDMSSIGENMDRWACGDLSLQAENADRFADLLETSLEQAEDGAEAQVPENISGTVRAANSAMPAAPGWPGACWGALRVPSENGDTRTFMLNSSLTENAADLRSRMVQNWFYAKADSEPGFMDMYQFAESRKTYDVLSKDEQTKYLAEHPDFAETENAMRSIDLLCTDIEGLDEEELTETHEAALDTEYPSDVLDALAEATDHEQGPVPAIPAGVLPEGAGEPETQAEMQAETGADDFGYDFVTFEDGSWELRIQFPEGALEQSPDGSWPKLDECREDMLDKYFQQPETGIGRSEYETMRKTYDALDQAGQQAYLEAHPDFAEADGSVRQVETLTENMKASLAKGSHTVEMPEDSLPGYLDVIRSLCETAREAVEKITGKDREKSGAASEKEAAAEEPEPAVSMESSVGRAEAGSEKEDISSGLNPLVQALGRAREEKEDEKQAEPEI